MKIFHLLAEMSFYDKVLLAGGLADLLIGAAIIWCLLINRKQKRV